ncbi:hypothetical protein ACKWTF_002236 [Chironomus riparius]
MTEQKRKIQTVVICGLLLFSIIDHTECRKTSSNSKSKSKSGSPTVRPKTNNPQQYANPASLSYSGISPNAPQQPKPSAPKIEQRPVQSLASPVNYPQSSNTNSRPVGWDVNTQQRPQSPPYPQSPQYPVNTNQQRPQSPPYPINQPQHNSPPYPQNGGSPNMNQNPAYNPQQPAYNPQQPAYNPQPIHNQNPSYNPQQPAYNPQQSAYNPQQPAYNPQQIHNQNPPFNPQQPAYNPQPGYNPQPAYNPQPGYNSQPAYHPQQPQIIQQQSSGPGLLKTVAVGAAAGLGTSLLFNSLTSKDEPKTTVIIVNNTQPIQPAPALQPEVATPLPIQNNEAVVVPVQEQNTQAPYAIQQSVPAQAQQIPVQENQQFVPFSPQQIPIQENQQQVYQQPPLQEQTQGIVQNQPSMIESQTTILPTIMPINSINTEVIPQNQTSFAETTTFLATTIPSSSTQDKVLPPVNALSSQVTESANLKDSVASYQSVNTQISMLVIALSCSISYLIQ